jgi:hypothetical protein
MPLRRFASTAQVIPASAAGRGAALALRAATFDRVARCRTLVPLVGSGLAATPLDATPSPASDSVSASCAANEGTGFVAPITVTTNGLGTPISHPSGHDA